MIFTIATCILAPLAVVYFWHWLTKRSASIWKISGSRTLITGGSKGIGKALAQMLLEKGGSVLLVARTESKLLETQKELAQGLENRVHILACSVADEDKMKSSIAAKMKEIGWEHLDAVVSNAGVSSAHLFSDLKKGDMERTMNINYFGTVYTIRATYDFLMKSPQQARVLVNSSMLGLLSFAGQSSYAPTKWALRGLCEAIQQEFYPNIIVSIVYPPDVNTDQLAEESSTAPSLTKEIQGPSTVIEPSQCAAGIVETLVSGDYSRCWTFDGFMVHSQCIGMSPASSPINTFATVFLGGILRIVGLGYAWSWQSLAIKYNTGKKD